MSKSKIGIVAAKWNASVTNKLLEEARSTLRGKGYDEDQIIAVRCPGTFEVPSAVQLLLPKVDGVVAIGAVIRGETPHFDYICQAVSKGIMDLNLEHNKPITFGVLTTNTAEQAAKRADVDSDYGNKGAEAALALVDMLALAQKVANE